MFKLVVLSALVAVAMAAPRPGYVAAPAAVAYAAPVVAHTSVVGSVPTSISSHSSSVVHNHAIHHTATVVDTPVVAPVVHAEVAPVVTANIATYAAAVPAVSTYSAHGLINTHGAVVASPVAYGVHGVHGIHGVHGVHGVHVL